MIILRKSPVTGKMNKREIEITEEQYHSWENGELIQDVMPNLSDDDREFIISGCTPEDFASIWPICL